MLLIPFNWNIITWVTYDILENKKYTIICQDFVWFFILLFCSTDCDHKCCSHSRATPVTKPLTGVWFSFISVLHTRTFQGIPGIFYHQNGLLRPVCHPSRCRGSAPYEAGPIAFAPGNLTSSGRRRGWRRCGVSGSWSAPNWRVILCRYHTAEGFSPPLPNEKNSQQVAVFDFRGAKLIMVIGWSILKYETR